MYAFLLCVCFALFTSAFRHDAFHHASFHHAPRGLPDFSQWKAPGPGDVRSPCPALNTLANHGAIHRDGKYISPHDVAAAASKWLNVDASFTLPAATVALKTSSNPPLFGLVPTTFNLDDLQEHNFIEHDGSLSRVDHFFGDVKPFSLDKWLQVLEVFGDAANITIEIGGKAHLKRVQNERAEDPEFTYGATQFVLANGETALYLSVLGDPVTGVAPVEYVKIFFEQERLPYNEGWRPTKIPTTAVSLNVMIPKIPLASGEKLPKGLVLGQSALANVFRGLDPDL